MHRQVLAIVLVLFLAGCAGGGGGTTSAPPTTTRTPPPFVDPGPPPPMESWKPVPCDPSGATQVSIDGELAPGLHASADDIARRIGDALGDPVVASPRPYEDTGQYAWPTATGSIFVQMSKPYSPGTPAAEQGTFVGASYYGQVPFTATKGIAFAQSLGATPTSLKHDARLGRIWQEWGGLRHDFQPPGRAGIGWANQTDQSVVGFGPFFRHAAQGYNVSVPRAEEIGSSYMGCYLESRGYGPANGWAITKSESMGLALRNETIVHLVRVMYTTPHEGPCGGNDAQWILVDAWTGAVLGREFAVCT